MGFCENTYREHVDMGSKLLQELKKENTNDSADAPFLIDFLYSFFFQKKLVFPSKTMADGDTSCLREVLGPVKCIPFTGC